jgi:mannose-6-phosphate isomerase-like protein (cupin superfamily)
MPNRYSKQAINLRAALSRFEDHWSPKIVAAMNDYEFKLVKFQGEFTWHDHKETDEVFLVLEGEMDIQMRDRTVTLREGEMFVVPKGVEHCPRARLECHALLVEREGTVNTGDEAPNRRNSGDMWIFAHE